MGECGDALWFLYGHKSENFKPGSCDLAFLLANTELLSHVCWQRGKLKRSCSGGHNFATLSYCSLNMFECWLILPVRPSCNLVRYFWSSARPHEIELVCIIFKAARQRSPGIPCVSGGNCKHCKPKACNFGGIYEFHQSWHLKIAPSYCMLITAISWFRTGGTVNQCQKQYNSIFGQSNLQLQEILEIYCIEIDFALERNSCVFSFFKQDLAMLHFAQSLQIQHRCDVQPAPQIRLHAKHVGAPLLGDEMCDVMSGMTIIWQ